MTMRKVLLAGISILALLTACGGGGGGSTTTTVINSLTPTTVITPSTFTKVCADGTVKTSLVSVAAADALCLNISTIITASTTPSFATATEELSAFTLLNAERSKCGFGLVAENIKLSAAAKAHADYLLINNLYSHSETLSFPSGFTGASVNDRATAAGYSWLSVTETVSGSVSQPSILGYGTRSVRSLNAAPYHLFGMMSPYTEIGISIRSVASVTPLVPNGLSRVAVYDFGVPSAGDYQTVGDETVLTYPCEGATGVDFQVTGEFPNPVPGRDLASNPLGHPILVMLRKGSTLVINTTSIVKVSTGTAVPTRTPITASNDPNGIFGTYGNYMGYVAPDIPLEKSTAYSVSITGSNNGKSFTKTFGFTTGTGG